MQWAHVPKWSETISFGFQPTDDAGTLAVKSIMQRALGSDLVARL